MKDSHLSLGADHEMQLVRAFFGETKGYFVMGANETSAMSVCRASRLQVSIVCQCKLRSCEDNAVSARRDCACTW